jgi:hypothetical protein
MKPLTNLTDHLEQFLEHERQQIDTLAGALEGHRVAMAELATVLALVRHQLFDESPHAQEDL